MVKCYAKMHGKNKSYTMSNGVSKCFPYAVPNLTKRHIKTMNIRALYLVAVARISE